MRRSNALALHRFERAGAPALVHKVILPTGGSGTRSGGNWNLAAWKPFTRCFRCHGCNRIVER